MTSALVTIPQYTATVKRVACAPIDWQRLSNQRVLITGASGLIGSFLVDVLMERNASFGDKISVVAGVRNRTKAEARFSSYDQNPAFTILEYDVKNPLNSNLTFDYILHAASNTHPVSYAQDSIGTITTNLIGTKNLLDYAIEHPVKRFCFLSTVEIYGESIGNQQAFCENDMGYIDSNTLRAGYSESKRCSEALCNAYAQTHGIDFVIPRLCRIYGPTLLDSDTKALSQFLRNAVNRQDIVLKSEGRQYFSYLHVADAVSAILTILIHGESRGAYNVADEASDITLRDLAQHLATIAQTKVIFQLPDAVESKGFSTATRAILDASKLKKLGWTPLFDIFKGLENTIEILDLSK